MATSSIFTNVKITDPKKLQHSSMRSMLRQMHLVSQKKEKNRTS